MSGHSKWANIKRTKAKVDAQRGQIFSKIARELIVAARAGGPNPDANVRLRAAIDKAREQNMPMDNIQRAIQRGSGGLEGANYESVTYEGYGPGGAAVLVQALTDNRNRTAGDIRYIFSKNGGNLGETGCVSWLFDRRAVVRVERAAAPNVTEDELLALGLDAGAIDLESDAEAFELIGEAEDLGRLRQAVAAAGIPVASAEITHRPQSTVRVEGEEARRLLRLLERLEEHDDVQEVYANFEIPDAELEGD